MNRDNKVKKCNAVLTKQKRNISKPKDVLKTPGQTKSSLHRQMLAQSKRLQSVSLVPDEVLYYVFKYLDASDLLRCCCVSKLWNEVATIPALWEKLFKQLPKSCRDFSTKAKTCGAVDWKRECLFCAKERRSEKVKKLLRESSLASVKKARLEATRTLNIRWLLVCENTDSQIFEAQAEEDFIFKDGVSIRWNNPHVPALSKMKFVKLYALTPVFYGKDWKPVTSSICTRSLIFVHEFKGAGCFTFMKPLHGDDHVDMFVLSKYMYFAVWKSSLPKIGDVAFIGVTSPLNNLLMNTQNGTSQRIYQSPHHKPVIDDVDPKYGMHGYKASITLRNCRKIYFYDTIKEIKDGTWKGNELNVQHRRYDDYIFYDIKDELSFLWKTEAIKGKIQDFVLLDVCLHDSNNEVMWSFSVPTKITKLMNEKHNYSYENCELWELGHQDELGNLKIEVIKNGSTAESTILTVTFQLQKSFVNQWFGTKY